MKRMVKILGLVMALTMLSLLMVAVPAGAATQLANGDFSAELEGWTVAKDTAEAVTESGNTFMSIYGSGANAESLTVEVKPGKTYVWTFDVLSERQTRVWVKYFNEDGLYMGDTYRTEIYVPASNSWSEASSAIGSAPKDASMTIGGTETTCDAAYATVVFNRFGSTAGKMYIDNVAMHELDSQTGELIKGGALDAETLPTNITADAATVVSGAEAHGGSGKALKLENAAAEDVKTVSAFYYAMAGQKMDVTVFMNLTALEAGTDAGVKLEVFDGTTYKRETSLFTAVGKGWRKMMVPVRSLSKAAQLEIRVTFTGKGTVLLDDISAVMTDALFTNGDLEALTSDFAPAGWTCSTAFTGKTADAAAYTAIEDGNTFAGFRKTNNLVMYKTVTLTGGVRYKLQFDFRSAGNSWNAMFSVRDITSGGTDHITGTYVHLRQTTTETASPWGEQVFYFTAPATKDYQFRFGHRAGGENALAEFDNISLTVVDDPDTLVIYDKNGVPTDEVKVGEDFTVRYTGFGTDYENEENNRKVHFTVTRYTEEGNAKLIDTIEISAESAAKLAGPDAANSGDVYLGDLGEKLAVYGEVPLVLEHTIEVPATGNYTYKAFAWDAKTPLVPCTAAAVLE